MKVEHPFLFIFFFVAGRILLSKIWNPSLSSSEKVFYVLLTAGFVVFCAYLRVALDELDEQAWKREAFE